MLDLKVVSLFIFAFCGVIVAVLGWFARGWATDIKTGLRELATSISGLSEQLHILNRASDLHDFKLAKQSEEIEDLQARVCRQSECPNYSPDRRRH